MFREGGGTKRGAQKIMPVSRCITSWEYERAFRSTLVCISYYSGRGNNLKKNCQLMGRNRRKKLEAAAFGEKHGGCASYVALLCPDAQQRRRLPSTLANLGEKPPEMQLSPTRRVLVPTD